MSETIESWWGVIWDYEDISLIGTKAEAEDYLALVNEKWPGGRLFHGVLTFGGDE